MRYTTVLFDLDHTLLDSDASLAAAFDATVRSIGLDSTPELYDTFDRINQALWRKVEQHELSPNEVKVLRFAEMLEQLGLDGDPVEMGATFVGALTDHGELYPGAIELLEWLSPRARLGLVTNGIGPVQRGRLERLGVADAFDAIVISGEAGFNKPGAAIFDLAFELLDHPERAATVMVGDNLGSDIQGGINASIDTIWFNPHGRANGTDLAPTHEAPSLAAIHPLVAGAD